MKSNRLFLTLSWQSLENQLPSITAYSAVMDSAGFMWVLDGFTNYNPGHRPGELNSVVAIVHGLLLYFLLLALVSDLLIVLAACTAANYFWNVTACVACPRNSSSPALSYQRTQCLCDPGTTGPNGGQCTGLRVYYSACLDPFVSQPALLVLGRHRLARLLATRRLLAFGHLRLLVTCSSVRRADSVPEVRLHRRAPDSVVRAISALTLIVFSLKRLFARRPWPVRKSPNDTIDLLRYEAAPRIGAQ
jgi:hypothetical protein